MTRPSRLLVLLSVLATAGLGGLLTPAVADSIALGETTTLAANKLQVTVTYAYTSAHGDRALLLLRVLPLERSRDFVITPLQLEVTRTTGTRSATFTVEYRGQGATTVSRLTGVLAQPGERRPNPFHRQELTVDWRFPLATGRPLRPATATETVEVPGGGTSAAALGEARALIREIRGGRPQRLAETLRDERLRKLMVLKMGVNQDEAANNPQVLENEPGHRASRPGEPGVNEGTTVTTDTPDPQAAGRVLELTPVNVDAPYRGFYVLNFTYKIGDVTGRTPITFDCVFDPAVAQWVTQEPWVHMSPDKDFTGSGYITLWIGWVDAPISLGKAPVTLRARGNGGQQYRRTKWVPKFSWYKACSSISYSNLQAYWTSPDAQPVLNPVRINEGSNSIAERFTKYAAEPTLLMFKTAQGTYCCGLFMPYRGSQGLEGVWIVDLDCFDAKGAIWTEGYLPADADDRARSTRSYTNAGLLTRGKGFDLDYHGFDCTQQEADIVVNVDEQGRYILRTLNGCEMRY